MPEDIESPERIFSSQGVPFKSEYGARTAIEKKGLNPDHHTIQSYEDGYVIVLKPKTEDEKYYRVRFSHKSSPDDEDDVTLIVNGEPLVLQRGVDTIIPARYKECADHANYAIYKQENPNESRKVMGRVSIFPYTLMGEATKTEYQELLKEGNKKTKKALEAQNKLI